MDKHKHRKKRFSNETVNREQGGSRETLSKEVVKGKKFSRESVDRGSFEAVESRASQINGAELSNLSKEIRKKTSRKSPDLLSKEGVKTKRFSKEAIKRRVESHESHLPSFLSQLTNLSKESLKSRSSADSPDKQTNSGEAKQKTCNLSNEGRIRKKKSSDSIVSDVPGWHSSELHVKNKSGESSGSDEKTTDNSRLSKESGRKRGHKVKLFSSGLSAESRFANILGNRQSREGNFKRNTSHSDEEEGKRRNSLEKIRQLQAEKTQYSHEGIERKKPKLNEKLTVAAIPWERPKQIEPQFIPIMLLNATQQGDDLSPRNSDQAFREKPEPHNDLNLEHTMQSPKESARETPLQPRVTESGNALKSDVTPDDDSMGENRHSSSHKSKSRKRKFKKIEPIRSTSKISKKVCQHTSATRKASDHGHRMAESPKASTPKASKSRTKAHFLKAKSSNSSFSRTGKKKKHAVFFAPIKSKERIRLKPRFRPRRNERKVEKPQPKPTDEIRLDESEVQHENTSFQSEFEDEIDAADVLKVHYHKSAVARDAYSNNWEHIAMLVALYVGSTNLYTFPGRLTHFGGYYYFVPYFICTFMYAIPVSYIEAYIGQFTQESSVIGFHQFAPILSLTCWADTIHIMINCLRNNLHIVLSLSSLIKRDAYLEHTECRTNTNMTSDCFSFLDDRHCSGNASTINQRFIKQNCLPARTARLSMVDPVKAILPLEVFFFKTTVGVSSGLLDIKSMNVKVFILGMIIVCLASALLTLPLRHYARVCASVLLMVALMLIALIVHIHSDWPKDTRDTPLMPSMLYPRIDRLFEYQTWYAALEHSILTYSVGQSVISTLSSFTRRRSNTLQLITVAILFDIMFGMLGVLIGSPMDALFKATQLSSVRWMDFVETRAIPPVRYLLKFVPEMLSYYETTFWIHIFALAVMLTTWNNVMVAMLYLNEFIIGVFRIKNKWKAILTTALLMGTWIAAFSFQNAVFLYHWATFSQHLLHMWSLLLKQIIVIGCYGAAQINFDIKFMHGERHTSKFWSYFETIVNKLYFILAIPVTLLYVTTTIGQTDWNDEIHIPLEFLRNRPYLASVLNPAVTPALFVVTVSAIYVYLKYEDKSELFKVQPGLPSYQRIRVEIQEEVGADLDDFKLRREGAPYSSETMSRGGAFSKTSKEFLGSKSITGRPESIQDLCTPLRSREPLRSAQVGSKEVHSTQHDSRE